MASLVGNSGWLAIQQPGEAGHFCSICPQIPGVNKARERLLTWKNNFQRSGVIGRPTRILGLDDPES